MYKGNNSRLIGNSGSAFQGQFTNTNIYKFFQTATNILRGTLGNVLKTLNQSFNSQNQPIRSRNYRNQF